MTYKNNNDGTIDLEYCRGGWHPFTMEAFHTLKSTGMLWEFYPEAPLQWPL